MLHHSTVRVSQAGIIQFRIYIRVVCNTIEYIYQSGVTMYESYDSLRRVAVDTGLLSALPNNNQGISICLKLLTMSVHCALTFMPCQEGQCKAASGNHE